MTDKLNSGYWDGIAGQDLEIEKEAAWRAYLFDIYRKLFLLKGDTQGGIILKTDLYDEAICHHNLFVLLGRQYRQVVGIDLSFAVAAQAKERLTRGGISLPNMAQADVRKLPFADNFFDTIISNSTLDHFSHKDDIVLSLKELLRILKPGGVLMITMDNPWNPAIALRNALPYGLLKAIGIIPFYMGVTLSRPELVEVLQQEGFQVTESRAIVHCPRILAIWAGFLVDKFGSRRVKDFFQKFLMKFESLEHLPSKYFSAYYVAVTASKG